MFFWRRLLFSNVETVNPSKVPAGRCAAARETIKFTKSSKFGQIICSTNSQNPQAIISTQPPLIRSRRYKYHDDDNIYLELQKQVNISLILSEDHMVWRLRTSEDASEGETSYLPGICVRTHIISNHIMDIVDMDMVDISNHIIYDAGVRAIHENILSGESDQRIKRRRIWRKPLLANFEITSIQGSIFGLRC